MKRNIRKVALALAAVLIIILAVSGCTTGTATRGWAGVAEVNGTLIFTSITGQVYAVDSATKAVIGTPLVLQVQASGGLSCIPSCAGPQMTPIAVYASPAVGGGLVIIGGFDGKVYAYPFIDGKLREQARWIYPPEGTVGAIVGGLVVANDNVYFAAANGTIYALNAADGYREWSVNLGNKIWSAPAISGDTLYIGSFDKKFYALNASDGTQKWVFPTNGAISCTPVIDGNTVYFGNFDRHFYALNATTGNLVWEFPITGTVSSGGMSTPSNWFWAKPVALNGVIYAPCLDGKVYTLDKKSGNLIEALDFQKPIASSPVVVGNDIIVAATDLAKNTSRVFVIDTTDRQSSQLTGFAEGINAPLFASNGMVYIHTTKDSFYSLDPQKSATYKFILTTTGK